MGACSCKKKTPSAYLEQQYVPSYVPTYGATTPTNTANLANTTKKPETTIQATAIKQALKKLQNLLQGCEVDEYVDELVEYHSKGGCGGISFEEYQRLMEGFESGVIPAIGDKSAAWEPSANKNQNQNLLLNALRQLAGGWKEEEAESFEHEENATANPAGIETKEEVDDDEGEEPEPFCFRDHYVDILNSCPEGCAIEAVEGLAEKSTFKAIPEATVKVDKSFLKILRKELRSLKKSLLLTPENSMFVRYDEDRPQFMRAVITGNSDSPYAYGAFLFDIFLPANYPTVPPKITHITPGATNVHANNGPGGFSPNMHQHTGKICLSLLGTWAGPGWDPKKSNLYQVLSTICFAILSVEHPYYMEPNFGGWEGTAPTENHKPEVLQYTEEVERGCVQYAMLGPLTKPYEHFEEILNAHFVTTRLRIITTMDKWIGKTRNISHHSRLQNERKGLLRKLQKVMSTESNNYDSSHIMTSK